MRALTGLFAAIAFALAPVAYAGAPRSSPRPKPRDPRAALVAPVSVPEPMPVPVRASIRPAIRVYYHARIRPKPRNPRLARIAAAVEMRRLVRRRSAIRAQVQVPVVSGAEVEIYGLASTVPVFTSPRPRMRPRSLMTRLRQRKISFIPVPLGNITEVRAVCGDPLIRGRVLAPIRGRLPGCGVARPVRVSAIAGVSLSQASIMDCRTARTLHGWIVNPLKPALSGRGGGVRTLSIASQYACRTRNNQPGAKISEHGKGRAIDISAFNLSDGSRITVKDG